VWFIQSIAWKQAGRQETLRLKLVRVKNVFGVMVVFLLLTMPSRKRALFAKLRPDALDLFIDIQRYFFLHVQMSYRKNPMMADNHAIFLGYSHPIYDEVDYDENLLLR